MRGFEISILLSLFLPVAAIAAPYDNPNGNTHVVCLHNPAQTYELYIPPTAPATQRPILYAFDPGGDGKAVLRSMAASALENGWIIAASNNSKNGPWQTIFDAQDAIIQDTEARWDVHPTRRFAAGFSGGARGSLALAFRFPEKICGVLCMGAGWPVNTDLLPGTDSLIVYIIIGGLDSNYCYDISETQGKLVQASVRCEVETIPYMDHVFPPASNVLNAARWLDRNAQIDRNAAYSPVECRAGSLFCHPPSGPLDSWTSFYSGGWDWSFYEDFQGIENSISRIDWWGISGTYNGMGYWVPAEPNNYFAVRFFADNGGVPGDLVYEEWVSAEMTELPAFYNNNYPLIHYATPLTAPLSLSSGWLSIEGFNFLWLTSPEGNSRIVMYDYAGGSTTDYANNLAVNLTVQPVEADFHVDHAWGELPHTATFWGSVNYLCGEEPAYLWEFGDGATSTDWPCAVHTYTEPGTYTVTLTVTTPTRSGEATKHNYIVAAENLPAVGLAGLIGVALLLGGIGSMAGMKK